MGAIELKPRGENKRKILYKRSRVRTVLFKILCEEELVALENFIQLAKKCMYLKRIAKHYSPS